MGDMNRGLNIGFGVTIGVLLALAAIPAFCCCGIFTMNSSVESMRATTREQDEVQRAARKAVQKHVAAKLGVKPADVQVTSLGKMDGNASFDCIGKGVVRGRAFDWSAVVSADGRRTVTNIDVFGLD